MILYNQGKTYIGRAVATYNGSDSDGKIPPDRDDILEADYVTLQPAYDFFAPLRPMQQPGGQVGYARDPVITPLDFTCDDVPVHSHIGSIIFLDEMNADDREVYESFVAGAEAQKEAIRKQRSAQKSGLILPDTKDNIKPFRR